MQPLHDPREIAARFRAQIPLQFNAAPGEVYPGGPGMVIREDAGGRILQSMTWGFLLLTRDMKARGSKPKPVNNIAAVDSFMRRFVAPKPEHSTGQCHWQNLCA